MRNTKVKTWRPTKFKSHVWLNSRADFNLKIKYNTKRTSTELSSIFTALNSLVWQPFFSEILYHLDANLSDITNLLPLFQRSLGQRKSRVNEYLILIGWQWKQREKLWILKICLCSKKFGGNLAPKILEIFKNLGHSCYIRSNTMIDIKISKKCRLLNQCSYQNISATGILDVCLLCLHGF